MSKAFERCLRAQKIREANFRNDIGFKILELMRETHFNNQDHLTLFELDDFIKEHAPELYDFHKNDTYDGPTEGEEWSGGFAENH